MIQIDKAIGPLIIPALTAEGGRGKNHWSVTNWIGGYIANKLEFWDKDAKRYVAWKEHVREHVKSQLPEAFAAAAVDIRLASAGHHRLGCASSGFLDGPRWRAPGGRRLPASGRGRGP